MRIIAGSLKGRQLNLPKGSQARPTADMTREAVFNRLSTLLSGARVLDLFAGSGAMGLEAISRGADFCQFVEMDRHNARAIQSHLDHFGVDRACYDLWVCDFRRALDRLAQDSAAFDIVFADPPYDAGYYGVILGAGARVLGDQGILVTESPVGTDLPQAQGLVLQDQRRYGSSMISFFRKVAT